MFLVLLLSLYISRTLLQVLGVEDFGIYNVVGGFVSFFGFLDATLSASMQRFYNIEIGRNMDKNVGRVYKNGIYANIIISLLLFVLLESFGLWYVNNIMVIPADRIIAANILFQIAVVSLVLTLMKIPYVSVILAYEKMGVYSIVIIIDIILKLISVLLLSFVESDSLIVYSVFLLIISTISFLCYYVYTKKRIKSISFCSSYDAELMKSMVTFSGWNLLGTFVYMLKYQGLNLVLNYFFGPVVNAARGIAMQVNSAITSFATNFFMAISPQITKQYAAGNIRESQKLVYAGARYSFYLLSLFTVPVVINIDYILKLWLGTVPEFTSSFLVITLISSLIYSLSNSTTTALQATGDIKWFQIGQAQSPLLELPAAYVILKLGYPPYYALLPSIVTNAIALIFRFYLLKKQVPSYSQKKYYVQTILKCFILFILYFTPSYFVKKVLPESFGWICVSVLTSIVFMAVIIYFLGIDKDERKMLNSFIKSKLALLKK